MNGEEKNKIQLRSIEGLPEEEVLDTLLGLYTQIFQDAQPEFFLNRLRSKEDLLSIISYSNKQAVGFKIGYRYDLSTYYSWIGGVLENFRKQGFGARMAQRQETWVREKNYKKLRTKSMNQYKAMMILNLKNGFDIVQIYTNQSGQTKLVFEKSL